MKYMHGDTAIDGELIAERAPARGRTGAASPDAPPSVAVTRAVGSGAPARAGEYDIAAVGLLRHRGDVGSRHSWSAGNRLGQ
ncbi:hypothetical protein MB901379_01188 [Mycobacterium basiliense]|uniref:Uncharacterized protein n=1 Tax=Mycobacterium basiliense TaxID=2094119 RepID=A0A3S4FP91_9MYCO|nr:hypothetical protein [Mycobacterium basiliense]VDM87644.1 hypothetical protein MB901379_01188 [Mycobacterium basiliense]